MKSSEIPERAVELHQRARQLGSSGDYPGAIQLLAEAQEAAPDWPYPAYDTAFTYLLLKDFAQARQWYEKTVQMAPRGFFTAITALDTLNREAKGELPEGVYAAYMTLEWIDDPAQKAAIVDQMKDRFPTFAPAWKEYALQCDEPAERLAALQKGLDSTPDAETLGILLLNQAATLFVMGETDQARTILRDMIADPATTAANEQLAKRTLESFESPTD